MKTLKTLLLAITIVAAAACNRGRHVIIVTQTNDIKIKLEYTGTIVVNPDKNRIVSISPNGYVNYDNNGNELIASPGTDGRIDYEINGEKAGNLNSNGQALLAEAVKMIAKHEPKIHYN
jgi:hypothetical protein